MFEYRPYSKDTQLGRKSQKEPELPKLRVKKPRKKRAPKKNLNVEVFHNRKIPHWKQRGAVKTKTANRVLRYYGEQCAVCGNQEYALHHIVHKGYGIGGRGVWTNLVPLCETHHTGADGVHTHIEKDQYWKDKHLKLFGPHYFKDMWDLWMLGLIESPTEELYERFMEQEREKIDSQGD